MKRIIKLLAFGFLLSATLQPIAAAAVGKLITIIVDVEPFDSVATAAMGEAQVNWAGTDTHIQNACTIGFAAWELQQHLEKLEWRSEDAFNFTFARVSDLLPKKAIILTTLAEIERFPALLETVEDIDLHEALASPGAYALISEGNRLFLVGADRTGTLYSVYHYLEFLGIRWYGPSESETFFPPNPCLRFPEEPIFQRPDFATRGFWVTQDRGNTDFYYWMARNRMNFWSIAEPNRALLQKLGMRLTYGGHSHFATFMNSHDPYPYDHPLFEGDEAKIADPYPPNPETFHGDTNEDGSLTYFEARPEWYGLIDGKRTPFEGYLKQANICTSNMHAVDHLNRSIIEQLAEGDWQDVTYLNFWPVDMGKWCEGELCAQLGTPTDRWLLMVHALSQDIQKARLAGRIRRDVKIVFPIYLETLPAPTRALPEDFDYTSCIGTFFPIQRCYVHSIDEPDCLEYNSEHWESFLDWTRTTPRHYTGELFVGEYFNVSVNKSLPVLYSRIIDEDIPKYFEQGIRHMHYMHTDIHHLGLKRINNYLFARKLWNTEADVPAILEAYYEDMYGSIAQEMKALSETLEFALSNIKQLRYWHHLPERISERQWPLFDKEHFQLETHQPKQNNGVDLAESIQAIQQCREIMDTLLKMDLKEPLQSRILLDDKMLRYGENTVYFYDAVVRAVIAEKQGNLKKARAEFKRSLPFARDLKAETVLVKTAVNHHVHAEDGLDATRIEEAFLEMGNRLFENFVF